MNPPEALAASVDEAARTYDLLFSLPKPWAVTATLTTTCLIASAFTPRFLEGLLAWSLPPILAALMAYAPQPKTLTAKRCLGASTAALLLQASAYLALRLIPQGPPPLPAVIASTALFTALQATILAALTNTWASYLVAPASFLTASPAYAAAFNSPLPLTVKALLTAQAIGAASAYLALRCIDWTTAGRGLRLFRAFAHAWLADDPSTLEAEALKDSEEARVEVTSLIFKSRRGVEGCFLTFSAHPGPFRNVGGSDLPATIADAVEGAIGGVCMPFHSTATHERDPASRTEAWKIVEAALHASIKASRLANPLYTLPASSSTGDPYIHCQVLGVPIITVTWRSQRAEDLPSSLGEELKELSEGLGLGPALVIEAHNHHLPGRAQTPPLSKVKARAKEAIEEALKHRASRIRAAFEKLELPWRLEELGRGGVRLALIEVDDTLSAYLLADANNLSPTLHYALLEELSRHELGFVEAYTTDTHSVVGLKPIKGGYKALGEDLDIQGFTSLVRDAVKSLRRQLMDVEVYVGVAEAQVRVLGAKGLETLIKLLRKGLRVTKVSLPLAYLASLLISLAVTLYLLVG